MKEELREVEVNKIVVNPLQPRQFFAQAELEELASSIRAVGIIHPPVVRRREDGMGYELVSGERRFRAAQIAGFLKIPVVIRDHTKTLSAQAALIENIQRVDLNPLEIAKALHNLAEQEGLNQEQLAERVGKKRSTVANYLRLLSLPKNIQDSLSHNAISMGHGKAILSIDIVEKQNLLHEIILRDGLTVRQAEEVAQRIVRKTPKRTMKFANDDCNLKHLADKIQQQLGTKVTIQGKGKGGRITIDYYTLDDLDRVLTHLV